MDGVQDWMDYDDNEDEDDDDYNMDQYWDISHKANQIYIWFAFRSSSWWQS